MFFNQDSTCVLKAKLAGAVATSQLKISVTYRNNIGDYHQDVVATTNGTTEITLLAAPEGAVVNIVELIKIYNPDTQANTVEILANDDVIFTCTVSANQSAILSQEGISNGLGYNPADEDLNNLTSTGKAVVSNLAMPSNYYVNLTLGASGSTYTAPADGYASFCKNSTATSQYLFLQNGSLRSHVMAAGNVTALAVFVPAKKNDQILYQYNVDGTTNWFRFVYAQGEV